MKRQKKDRKGNYNSRARNERDTRTRNESTFKGDARNDVSWYNRNPNLLLAAGSFPYPNRPGMVVNYGTYKPTATSGVVTNTFEGAIPGAMVLDWIPNLGRSQVATDPASVLGKEIYARVRQVYAGALEADAPDFVMYVMAMDSIFSYIAWLKRVYRCINAWSPENYFTPDGVLTAFGFTPAEIVNLRTEKTELWQDINDLVLQSHKFTVPSSMDVFNRHYWMSDNIYTDAQSLNAQFYIFNLQAVYKYQELNMQSGDPAAGLAMTLLPTAKSRSSSLHAKDLYQFGVALINALVAWDDAYTINGYLRRAFEGDSQFIVSEIASTEILTPVYEPEVLMQIENSRAIPRGDLITDFSGFNVSQDVLTNAVISNPKYTIQISSDSTNIFTHQMYNLKPTLSVRSDTPTVADSVVASRLQSSVEASVSGGSAVVTVDAGTEVPVKWKTSIMVLPTHTYEYKVYHQTPCFTLDISKPGADFQSQLNALVDMFTTACFDWAPFSFVTYETVNGTTGVWWGQRIMCDIHNITTISKSDLENLHRVCIYSEFNSFGLI